MSTAPSGHVRVLAPGSRLGRYVVGERIARGGMAEVYLAKIEGIGGFSKPVALKLILPAFADDLEFRRMFLAEARLVAGLDHPNIAQVIDVGEADGELFITMEYVHGRTLRRLIVESEQPPPLAVGLFAVREACRALHYAHEAVDAAGQPMGIVHRDISPSNLMVRYDGEVKLLDFGVAKASSGSQATRSGVLKGKGGYMSPEQCLGLPLDRRSDIFALGILLYEITTRCRLFSGDNDYEVLSRIVEGRYRLPSTLLPDYPVALEDLVVRALERSRDDRIQDAQLFREELEQVSAELGVEGTSATMASHVRAVFGPPPTLSLPEARATVASEPPPIEPRVERSRIGWLLAAGAGVALGGIGVTLVRAEDDPAAEDAPVQVDTAAAMPAATAPRVAAPAIASPPPAAKEASRREDPVTPDARGDVEPPKNDALQPTANTEAEAEPEPTARAARRTGRGTKRSTSRKRPKREPLIPWSK